MPEDITQVTDDDLEKYLEGIRERRLRAFQIYKQVEEEKKQLQDERAREQLTKQLGMMEKELARVDTAIEKIEKRASNIRALRLQLGIE